MEQTGLRVTCIQHQPILEKGKDSFVVQQQDKERLATLWATMPNLRFAAKHTMLLACRYNATAVVTMMLDEDFPVDQRLDGDKNTPLLAAVVSNSLDVIDLLLGRIRAE